MAQELVGEQGETRPAGTPYGRLGEARRKAHYDPPRLQNRWGLQKYVYQIIRLFILMFSSITKNGVEDVAAGLRKHLASQIRMLLS